MAPTICTTCGDAGVQEAIIFCVNCRNIPAHRYCVFQRPAAHAGPVRWVCDDCKEESTSVLDFATYSCQRTSQTEGAQGTGS